MIIAVQQGPKEKDRRKLRASIAAIVLNPNLLYVFQDRPSMRSLLDKWCSYSRGGYLIRAMIVIPIHLQHKFRYECPSLACSLVIGLNENRPAGTKLSAIVRR